MAAAVGSCRGCQCFSELIVFSHAWCDAALLQPVFWTPPPGRPRMSMMAAFAAQITLLNVYKLDSTTRRQTKDPEAIERFTIKLKKVSAQQVRYSRFLCANVVLPVYEADHAALCGNNHDISGISIQTSSAVTAVRLMRTVHRVFQLVLLTAGCKICQLQARPRRMAI